MANVGRRCPASEAARGRTRRSAPEGRAPTRAGTWVATIAKDRRALVGLAAGAAIDRRGSHAVARLLDTRWRAEAEAVLRRVGDEHARSAGLCYARGLVASAAGDADAAVGWLTRAQSALDRTERALGARIAFELGYLYALRGRHVAEAVLAWGRGLDGGAGATATDVVHLAALTETLAGDHTRARALYYEAVRRADDALTPRSRVLALSNLAVSLTHTDPRESAHLSGLALATHRSHDLHPRSEIAMRNALGYTLICCGEPRDAARVLRSVAADARAIGLRQIELYAQFNLAIIDELQGRATQSSAELRAIAEECARVGLDELAGWCTIRLAWLELLLGNAPASRALLGGLALREAQIPAAAVIHALLARVEGRLRTAATSLRRVIDDYRGRGDDLNTFTGLLWLGAVEHDAGHTSASAAAVTEALALGQSHGFRLATSWWCGELVDAARRLAPADLRDHAAQLIAPATPPAQASWGPRVEISRDGDLSIDGDPLAPGRWRVGRTGRHVLRRLFTALVAAYPSALRRDELTDFLWPESEGDSAVANLYGAVNDLRAVAADVPGVAVISREGAYALVLGPNVEVVDLRPNPAPDGQSRGRRR